MAVNKLASVLPGRHTYLDSVFLEGRDFCLLRQKPRLEGSHTGGITGLEFRTPSLDRQFFTQSFIILNLGFHQMWIQGIDMYWQIFGNVCFQSKSMCFCAYLCVQEMLRCVWRHLVAILKGRSQTLCYTSSLLHTLGSVTVSKTGLNDLLFSLFTVN